MKAHNCGLTRIRTAHLFSQCFAFHPQQLSRATFSSFRSPPSDHPKLRPASKVLVHRPIFIMAFYLRNSRKSSLSNIPGSTAKHVHSFIRNIELHSQSHQRNQAVRRGGIEEKQGQGNSLSVSSLLLSFAGKVSHCSHSQVPFLLLCPFRRRLLLLPQQNLKFPSNSNTLLYDLNNLRSFSSIPDGEMRYDSEAESGDENELTVVEPVQSKADQKEVEKVCKLIDETFMVDRNMEVVLDECGLNLSHDLVVDVLERFKHARKPAFRFFCWASQKSGFVHNSRTYNAMMNILGNTRQFETMVSILEEMGEKGLLTMETFVIAIRTFAAAKERKKAVGIFDLMKKHKFKVGVETINCLLDALGKKKLGKEAQALFEKLEHRFTPNLRTYTVLLNGWCRLKNLMEAGRTWNVMIDKGFKPDIVAHNTMLEGLLRGKKWADAIKLFEVMKAKGPFPNTRSYTILIKDLCKHGKLKEASDYLDEMLGSECEPDAAIYTCLMTGFGNQKKMDMVYGLLKEMNEKGCPPDAQTYNALIKMMTSGHMPDDAVRIYKKMIKNGIQPSIHTYNMIMKSYFVTRNYDKGYAFWEEMKRKGCCPDENSYTVFIGGLIRQGRSIEACEYLEEMIQKGMKAPQLDYNRFVADFSRAGKPYIMEELAQKMKFSGKFEVANLFARWAEMMKRRVKKRDPPYG